MAVLPTPYTPKESSPNTDLTTTIFLNLQQMGVSLQKRDDNGPPQASFRQVLIPLLILIFLIPISGYLLWRFFNIANHIIAGINLSSSGGSSSSSGSFIEREM